MGRRWGEVGVFRAEQGRERTLIFSDGSFLIEKSPYRGKCGCRRTCGGQCAPSHPSAVPTATTPALGYRPVSVHSPRSVPRRPGATGQVSHIKSHLCGQRGGRPACRPHRDTLSSRAHTPPTLLGHQHPPPGRSSSGRCEALACVTDIRVTLVTWPLSAPRTRAVRPGREPLVTGWAPPGHSRQTHGVLVLRLCDITFF